MILSAPLPKNFQGVSLRLSLSVSFVYVATDRNFRVSMAASAISRAPSSCQRSMRILNRSADSHPSAVVGPCRFRYGPTARP